MICFDINLMVSVLLLATTSLAVEEQDIDVVQGDKVTLKCRYDSAKYLERNIYFPPKFQLSILTFKKIIAVVLALQCMMQSVM